MDYKKAYSLLVGIMSNAIDEINKSPIIFQEMENTIQMLKEGLEKAEKMYICSDEQD